MTRAISTNADRPFRELLWRELDARGLIPSAVEYQRLRDAVARSGEVSWRLTLGGVGRDRWDAANATLSRPWISDDPQRILGFGWWMTRFLIAPLRLPEGMHSAVADAGALANLIVALYDQLVDSGRPGPAILAPTAFDSSAHAQLQWQAPEVELVDPSKHVMGALVDRYFDLVAAIPPGPLSNAVDALHPRAIRRMYDAENQLAEGDNRSANGSLEDYVKCVPVLQRRKAALPFVVMGLPGWSAASGTSSLDMACHLRWMYRVGTFLGWIDDAVDLDDDLAGRAANRVRCAIGAHSSRAAALAISIAHSGARCMDDWRRHTGREPPPEPEVTNALRAAIYSWFGAARPHA